MKQPPEFKYRKNYISTDGLTALSGLGEYFEVSEEVMHDDDTAGIATIQSFEHVTDRGEVRVHTDRGYAHLGFLVKLEK